MAVADIENPLTDEDLEQINQGLQDIEQAKQLIRKARQAGIDLSDRERQLDEDRNKLLKIKQAFFPGR